MTKKGNTRTGQKQNSAGHPPFQKNSGDTSDNQKNSDGTQIHPNKQCCKSLHMAPAANLKDEAEAIEISRDANRISTIGNNIAKKGYLANLVMAIITLIALALSFFSYKLTANSLEDSQQQFIAANRPYLQISDFVIPELSAVNDNPIKYRIQNLGAQPAKILQGNIRIDFRLYYDSLPRMDSLPKKGSEIDLLRYVSKESPYTGNIPLPILDTITVEGAKNGALNMWLTGVFTFKNLVTEENGRYEFRLKILPPYQKGVTDIIYNDVIYQDPVY